MVSARRTAGLLANLTAGFTAVLRRREGRTRLFILIFFFQFQVMFGNKQKCDTKIGMDIKLAVKHHHLNSILLEIPMSIFYDKTGDHFISYYVSSTLGLGGGIHPSKNYYHVRKTPNCGIIF